MAKIVAIAGGTSGWGGTIIEQIQKENKFQIVVLTRGESRTEGKIQYVQVDYSDIPALAADLNRHGIHSIISAIGMYDESRHEAQLNLIDAANKSGSVKRFIPCEYSYFTDEKYAEIDPGMKWWLEAAEKLKQSKLEYTRVNFGTFMDFLGLPNAISHVVAPQIVSVDTVRGRAMVPADGTTTFSMTYSYDAAMFLAKLLGLEDEWPEFSCCVGDDINFLEIIKAVEDATHKKLRVTYIDAEEINSGSTRQIEAALSEYNDPNEPNLSFQDLVGFASLGNQLTLAGALDIPRQYRLDVGFKARSLQQFLAEVF